MVTGGGRDERAAAAEGAVQASHVTLACVGGFLLPGALSPDAIVCASCKRYTFKRCKF